MIHILNLSIHLLQLTPSSLFFHFRILILAKELLKSFSPISDANLHHVRKILEFLFIHTDLDAFTMLFSESSHFSKDYPALFDFLRFINLIPVSESLLTAIFYPIKRNEKKKEIYSSLQSVEFVETLIEILYQSGKRKEILIFFFHISITSLD